jgi:hypothetical protein
MAKVEFKIKGSSPNGVLFKTIEPTQYTSYRTGDEGWRVQNNWFDYTPPTYPIAVAELNFASTSFFNVLKNPLVVNGVSSTTRFVDVNGIQAFSTTANANLVVIDKLTGLMYTRTLATGSSTWNTKIDDAIAYSISVNSITYDDWFLSSSLELQSIHHNFLSIPSQTDTLTNVILFSTFDFLWSATTSRANSLNAYYFGKNDGQTIAAGKTTTFHYIFVRNARNLITAP